MDSNKSLKEKMMSIELEEGSTQRSRINVNRSRHYTFDEEDLSLMSEEEVGTSIDEKKANEENEDEGANERKCNRCEQYEIYIKKLESTIERMATNAEKNNDILRELENFKLAFNKKYNK